MTTPECPKRARIDTGRHTRGTSTNRYLDGQTGLVDRFMITIWDPGTDPDDLSNGRLYEASGDLGEGNIKIHD